MGRRDAAFVAEGSTKKGGNVAEDYSDIAALLRDTVSNRSPLVMGNEGLSGPRGAPGPSGEGYFSLRIPRPGLLLSRFRARLRVALNHPGLLAFGTATGVVLAAGSPDLGAAHGVIGVLLFALGAAPSAFRDQPEDMSGYRRIWDPKRLPYVWDVQRQEFVPRK